MYLILQLYSEHGTIILAILEAPQYIKPARWLLAELRARDSSARSFQLA